MASSRKKDFLKIISISIYYAIHILKYYFQISHRLWVPFSNHSSNHTGTIPKNFQLRQRTTTIFKGKNAIFWQQNETLSFADICNLNQIYEFWQISRRTNIDFITMTSSKVTAQKEEKRAVAETQSITPLLRTEQNIKQLLIFNSRDFSSDKWFGNDSFH